MVRVNLNCTHVIITEMWSQLVGAWEPVSSKGKQGKAGIKIHNKNEWFLKFGKHTLWKIIKNGNLSQVEFTKKKLYMSSKRAKMLPSRSEEVYAQM